MILKKPFVSISVTTFNQKNYIKDCLDGILNQRTTFQFEIILGEDQSNDGTREVCQDYAKRYPEKIKLFLRSRKDVIYINGNATGRYNFLENLKACRGKYIALCEGDDYWTDPLKLQKQVDFLEANENYSMCGAVAQCIRQTSEKRSFFGDFIRAKKSILKVEDFLLGYSVHTSTVVFRQKMLQIPDWFVHISNGDVCLFALIAEKGPVRFINDPVSVYRLNDNGIWSSASLEKRYYAFKNTVNHLNKHFKGTYKKQQYNWEFNEAKKVAQEFLNKKSYKQYVKFILKNYHRYFWWFIWLPKQTQIINFIRNSVQTYWIKFRMFVGLRTHLKKITALFSTAEK